jgi:acetoin utilization deacetylase AcuC-like enzyme
MSSLSVEVILQREMQGASPIIVTSEGNKAGQEVEERSQRIIKGLERLPECNFSTADVSDCSVDSVLQQIHDQEYLEFLAHWNRALVGEALLLDYPYLDEGIKADTPLFEGVYDLSREGIRTAIAAAQQVAHGASFSYALCRPPGHHAGPAWLGGYCFLNNAVASVVTLLNSGIGPIGLIDIDFHFGNGSAALLAERPDVWFGSIHNSTILSYPYKDVQPASDRQTFVSFSHPPSSEEFLTQVDQLIQKSLDFGCAALVVSVGYDIIINDPHGGWDLPPSIFEEIGQILAQASIPLCFVQEGGYLLDSLEECAYKFGFGLLQSGQQSIGD